VFTRCVAVSHVGGRLSLALEKCKYNWLVNCLY
jgi:hypothetical protein